MYRSSSDRQAEAARYRQMTEESQTQAEQARSRSPGDVSNQRIQARNRGVRPQFIDDIGGCSANYR